MKHYNTTNRVLTIVAVVMILADIALGALIWIRESEPRWEESYPMANANMQWAYTSDARCQP